MLLRRITGHLRSQNWLAVGLDLAVVVVGVVLGLQVTQWNESQQQRARETAALVRLHEEAVEIVTYLKRLVERLEANVASQDRAVAALSDGSWPEVDPSILENGLNTFVFYPAIAPPRSVYDELVGSGVFADISNPKVRAAVASYYAGLDFIQGQVEYFRVSVQGDSSTLYTSPGARSVYDPGVRARQRIEYDFELLVGDPIIMSSVVRLLRNQIVFQSYRQDLLDLAESMLVELEQFTSQP